MYSQGKRYRRIISDDETLGVRLNELKLFFVNSGYPDKFVSSILDKILCTPRSLKYNEAKKEKDFVTPWIVTYGPGFSESRTVAKEVNELLSLSDTWREDDGSVKNVVQVVSRRAPNLQDILFKRKSFALHSGGDVGTVKCCPDSDPDSNSGCQTCKLVSNASVLHHRNNIFRTAGGDCDSFNLVYCFKCKICDILYVGKTVDSLRNRMNGHRSKFYDVLRQSATGRVTMGVVDDEQIVGAHLVHDHQLKSQKDFNKSYKVFILAYSDPLSLRRTEQLWIDKLKTLRPFGLNQKDSVRD